MFYPIFVWSWILRWSTNLLSDDSRSPDWSGLVTDDVLGLFVGIGTQVVFLFSDIEDGWRTLLDEVAA